MRIEILDGTGAVENTIEADENFAAGQSPGRWRPVEQPAPPDDPRAWWIDIGPFFDRFGVLMLPICASPDAEVQALVKIVSVRKYIDLRRSDLPAMLDLLIAKGFGIDKSGILGTRPTDYERHKG